MLHDWQSLLLLLGYNLGRAPEAVGELPLHISSCPLCFAYTDPALDLGHLHSKGLANKQDALVCGVEKSAWLILRRGKIRRSWLSQA
jgi:hypothetical protein